MRKNQQNISYKIIVILFLVALSSQQLMFPKYVAKYTHTEGCCFEHVSIGKDFILGHTANKIFVNQIDPSTLKVTDDAAAHQTFTEMTQLDLHAANTEKYPSDFKVSYVRVVGENEDTFLVAGWDYMIHSFTYTSATQLSYAITYMMDKPYDFNGPHVEQIAVRGDGSDNYFYTANDLKWLYKFMLGTSQYESKMLLHINGVKHIALNKEYILVAGKGHNLQYIKSTDGSLMSVFNLDQISTDIQTGSTSIGVNGICEMEMLNDEIRIENSNTYLGYFLIAGDNSTVYLWDSKSYKLASKQLVSSEQVYELTRLQYSYFVAARTDTGIYFIDYTWITNGATAIVDTTPDYFKVPIDSEVPMTQVFWGKKKAWMAVGTDVSLQLIQLGNNIQDRSCNGADAPMSGRNCLACADDFTQVQDSQGSLCVRSCDEFTNQQLTGSTTCTNMCVADGTQEKFNYFGLCKNCHANCVKCNFANDNSCISCSTGMVLDKDGVCKAACSVGTYQLGEECRPCPMGCSECELNPITSNQENVKCTACVSNQMTLSTTENARCSYYCNLFVSKLDPVAYTCTHCTNMGYILDSSNQCVLPPPPASSGGQPSEPLPPKETTDEMNQDTTGGFVPSQPEPDNAEVDPIQVVPQEQAEANANPGGGTGTDGAIPTQVPDPEPEPVVIQPTTPTPTTTTDPNENTTTVAPATNEVDTVEREDRISTGTETALAATGVVLGVGIIVGILIYFKMQAAASMGAGAAATSGALGGAMTPAKMVTTTAVA